MNKVYIYIMSSILTGISISKAASPIQTSAPTQAISSISSIERMVNISLNDAVSLALRRNRAIHGTYLDRIAQKFDLKVEQDRFSPKVVISARYLNIRDQGDRYRQTELIPQTTWQSEYGTQLSLSWSNQLTNADNSGRTQSDGATFTIIQPLLKGAGRDIATAPLQLAKLSEQSNKLSLKSTISETITQVINAYRNLLQAQEQEQISRASLKRSQNLLEANKLLISVGRMAQFDLVQTEADIANQELFVEEASNQIEHARLELLTLLALDLNSPIRASDTLEPKRIDLALPTALQIAQERQPNYLIQLIQVEVAAVNLRLAKNAKLWNVSLIGGATQSRNRLSNEDYVDSSRNWQGYGGVQIDVPINDMSLRQAEVRAQVSAENRDLALLEAKQQLQRDVEDSVRDLGARWRQLEIAQRAKDLARRKVEIEREKLQAGRSSNFQVISYEADLRSAENSSLAALINYLNTQSRLDKVLGTTLETWKIEIND